MDISAKVEIIRALAAGKTLGQLRLEFTRLTELDIKTVLKQLRDDGFVRAQPAPVTAGAGTPITVVPDGAGDVYTLTAPVNDVERELFRRGMLSRTKGTLRQSELKKKE
jgi:hypothetical protein